MSELTVKECVTKVMAGIMALSPETIEKLRDACQSALNEKRRE